MNIIELQPGDVLVVRTTQRLTLEQKEACKQHLGRALGAGLPLLIIDSGDQLDAIRKAALEKADTWAEVEGSDAARRAALNAELAERNEQREREQEEAWAAAENTQGAGDREVQHVDSEEEEPSGLEPHVWLYPQYLTELQKLAPYGQSADGKLSAVRVEDLTETQRKIPRVAAQLVPTNVQ